MGTTIPYSKTANQGILPETANKKLENPDGAAKIASLEKKIILLLHKNDLI